MYQMCRKVGCFTLQITFSQKVSTSTCHITEIINTETNTSVLVVSTSTASSVQPGETNETTTLTAETDGINSTGKT